MEEFKLTKQDQNYENALGLFSLQDDAVEEYTPTQFLSLDKKYHPVFTIRPFRPGEREKYQDLSTRLASINKNDYDFSDKVLDINKKVGFVVANAVLDIQNFYELKNRKFYKKKFEKVNGHISGDDINSFTEYLKQILFDRVSCLSGFNRSDKASL